MKKKIACIVLGALFMVGGSVSAAETDVGVCMIGVESPCNGSGSGAQTGLPAMPGEFNFSDFAKLFSDPAHRTLFQHYIPGLDLGKNFHEKQIPNFNVNEVYPQQ